MAPDHFDRSSLNLTFFGALQLYDKAIEKCIQINGFENPTLPRLYFNKAVVYEDEARMRPDDNSTENYGLAYDDYKNAYAISKAVFGSQHARTERYRKMLREPTYEWFARRRNDNVEEFTIDDVIQTQKRK